MSAGYVGGHCRGLAAGRGPSEEQLTERQSELTAHGAVEDEVDGAVDEDRNVEDVAEWNVDVVEDTVVDAAEEGQHALRQLGGDEAQDHGDEHRRRAGVLPVAVRLLAASGRPQPTALGGRAPHRRHEQAAQHGQQDARHHLKEDAEQPEVDDGERFREERRRVEPVVGWRFVDAGRCHRRLHCCRGVAGVGDRQRYDVVLDVIRRAEDRSRYEHSRYCHLIQKRTTCDHARPLYSTFYAVRV